MPSGKMQEGIRRHGAYRDHSCWQHAARMRIGRDEAQENSTVACGARYLFVASWLRVNPTSPLFPFQPTRNPIVTTPRMRELRVALTSRQVLAPSTKNTDRSGDRPCRGNESSRPRGSARRQFRPRIRGGNRRTKAKSPRNNPDCCGTNSVPSPSSKTGSRIGRWVHPGASRGRRSGPGFCFRLPQPPIPVAPAQAGAQPHSHQPARGAMMRCWLDPGLPKGQFILSACLGRQSKGRGDGLFLI